MAPQLELREIDKAFGALPILCELSMSIGEGEFVSVVGPSGAGKSTILALLVGEQRQDRGAILFEGAPLGVKSPHFAFMPQRDALMPWRRVIDNATLGLEVGGMRRAAARRKVAPLIVEFGLDGFEQHYPAQLSGGMRQRVALLRTVVQDRPVVLLDEPFGALDALTRARMQRWLEETWSRHRWTTLLVTHDVREAVLLSDRIYVLSARPAHVAREVSVPLARPRRVAGKNSLQADAIEAEILDLLLSPSSF